MAFSLPGDLATNWADNVGMIENAAYLNAVGTMSNSLKAALNTMVGGAAVATVATSETTTSASYANLATTTDTVTATIGSSGIVLVFLQAETVNSSAYFNYTSVDVSGANTVAASDANALRWAGTNNLACGMTVVLSGLSTGSTTFKMKYKTTGGTGTWLNRRIGVLPLP